MYFENARRIVGAGKEEDLVELCLLFIHCLEVSIYLVAKANLKLLYLILPCMWSCHSLGPVSHMKN